LAEIVTVTCELTDLVPMLNVAELLPAGTVTNPGTIAVELLLARETFTPPCPAAPVRVTVPVVEVPPTTVGGLIEIAASVAGVIVRFADCELPFAEAVIAAVCWALTATVDTVKVAEF